MCWAMGSYGDTQSQGLVHSRHMLYMFLYAVYPFCTQKKALVNILADSAYWAYTFWEGRSL